MTNPNPLPIDGVSQKPLLPCPYCGSKAYLRDDKRPIFIECDECGAVIEGEDGSFEQAVAAWNRRSPAIPPAAGGVSEARMKAACEAFDDKLFNEDETIAHMAASPYTVEFARARIRPRIEAALEAALALSPAAGQPVAIKGLEWDAAAIYAQMPFGAYTLSDDGDGKWDWHLGFSPYGDDGEAPVDTKEAAQTAAQADFERRIRSALAPIPERVNAVVESGHHKTMWAEVVETYEGDGVEWSCQEESGRDADTRFIIELAADTFPLGTRLEIFEPDDADASLTPAKE